MASRSSWTGSFLSGEVTNNYNASSIMGSSWGGSATADATASYASGVFGNTGFSSTSKIADYSKYYSAEGAEAFKSLGLDTSSYFQDFGGFSPLGGTGWTFITAPEEISWRSNSQVERQTIYGTNTPPVVVGSRGMRDLTISNALVEGFSRLRTVEDKIIDLENLQNFSLNGSAGFVNAPVYQVWANNKKYGFADGADGGYFVIESVSVKETMRDLDGNATRAYVDISFIQVPSYQVDSGRDQASSAQSGVKSALVDVPNQADRGLGGSGSSATRSTSGSTAPSRTGSGSTSSQTRNNGNSGSNGTGRLGTRVYDAPPEP
jgi:hypothetical protein